MQDESSQKKLTSRRLERTSTPGIYRRGRSYCVCFRDQTGKQRRRAARTLAEARALKASLTTDVKRGEFQPASKVTFADYAAEWIEGYTGRTSRGFREVTRSDYRRRLEPAIGHFGRTKLTDISPRVLRAYAESLAARGLARNTVRLHLAPLKALLATALDEGLIRTNPAAGLRLMNGGNGHEEQAKALTEEELRRVLEEIPAGWRLVFEFLAHTGLRIGEAIALRWSDVDLSRRRVTVARSFHAGRFEPPKSRFGRRVIPLSTRMAQELELLFLTIEDLDQLVFPSSAGTVLDTSNLAARVLKPAARRAGVPWVGFHTFRHTCATTLFRRGLNPKVVQMWLGHHSPAFTLGTYVHLIPDDLPSADFLDDVTAPGGNIPLLGNRFYECEAQTARTRCL
jgi:integrase